MSNDYPAFAKIPRLFRDIVVTEKLDGTNGLISIQDITGLWVDHRTVEDQFSYLTVEDRLLAIRAGSRNRWLSPTEDNFGFAQWIGQHAEMLVELGPGLHYGEWWGSGIQRGYGLTKGEKRFSLFNTGRWNADNIPGVPGLGVVPVLYTGPNDGWGPTDAAARLRQDGSVASPGFMRPEGIIIYHTAARTYSKVTLENDGAPKGQAA